MFVQSRIVVLQSSSNKRRLSSKATSRSESSTPKGVVRKLLKPRQPAKPTSRGAKKTVDKDGETSAGEDAGSAVIGRDSKTSTPTSMVSAATKLKLAAFSASEVGVCCVYFSAYSQFLT